MSLSVNIIDNKKNKVGDLELKENIFAKKINKGLLYSSVKGYLTNLRRGTASTKTRAEVRGGGKKPWKQKGTGRARAGSIRSPIRKGGGVAFGPSPRTYIDRLTKKEKKHALKCALSLKVQESQLHVLETISIEQPKTKLVVNLLKELGINGNVLFLVSGENENLELGAKNIPNVDVFHPNKLNAFYTLNNATIVSTKEAIIELEKKLEN